MARCAIISMFTQVCSGREVSDSNYLIPLSLAPRSCPQNLESVASPANKSLGSASHGRGEARRSKSPSSVLSDGYEVVHKLWGSLVQP